MGSFDVVAVTSTVRVPYRLLCALVARNVRLSSALICQRASRNTLTMRRPMSGATRGSASRSPLESNWSRLRKASSPKRSSTAASVSAPMGRSCTHSHVPSCHSSSLTAYRLVMIDSERATIACQSDPFAASFVNRMLLLSLLTHDSHYVASSARMAGVTGIPRASASSRVLVSAVGRNPLDASVAKNADQLGGASCEVGRAAAVRINQQQELTCLR